MPMTKYERISELLSKWEARFPRSLVVLDAETETLLAHGRNIYKTIAEARAKAPDARLVIGKLC